jgi:hypothetical protein
MPFQHQFACASSQKQTIDSDGFVTTTLVVLSNIPIDLEHADYDNEKLSQLTDAIVNHIKVNDHINKGEITFA